MPQYFLYIERPSGSFSVSIRSITTFWEKLNCRMPSYRRWKFFTSDILTDGLMLQELEQKLTIMLWSEFNKVKRDGVGFSPFYKLGQNMYKDDFARGLKIYSEKFSRRRSWGSQPSSDWEQLYWPAATSCRPAVGPTMKKTIHMNTGDLGFCFFSVFIKYFLAKL